ncbi:unnamed protein product [Rhizophagus irregularis]|nr:unnamed protein product [Rhizophagus irregularis]
MSSELELSKQRIAELEAENVNLRRKLSVSDAEIAELKRSNNEFLRANKEHNERRDAENAKLRVTIEELKTENIEVRDRLTKVEQNQLQNEPRDTSHNSSNNNSSNFNLVAIPEAITVPTNSAKRHNGKSLKEKDMDQFLLEAHKKIVSSEIKQCNKEKKLKKAEQASLNQDQESGTSNPERIILAVSNPVTKISAGAPLPKNSHRKKGAENISQMISDGIQNDSQSQKCILGSSNDILLQQSQISSTVPLLTLAQLFDKATDAEYEDLSILRKKRSEETGLQLPEITRKYLQGKTQKAVKIYNLFEKRS